MKTSTILFIIALTLPFLAAVTIDLTTYADLKKNGAEAAVVKSKIEFYQEVIEANGTVVERDIHIGYFDYLTVEGGIQVIHDAAMGERVKIVGPKAAIENLSSNAPGEAVYLKFKKPIRLSSPLQIHINLDAHNLGKLGLYFGLGDWQQAYPALVTKTPIKTAELNINGCLALTEAIRIENAIFGLNHGDCAGTRRSSVPQVVGSTKKLRSFSNAIQRTDMAQMNIKELSVNYDFPSGQNYELNGESITLYYSNYRPQNQDELDAVAFIPDTLLIKKTADLEVLLNTDFSDQQDGSQLVHVIRQ